jgi:DNA-binding MarR family transcriptional regulator
LRRVGIEDINAVQALLLDNIGENDVVIRDLKDRGYYQGSNVSYNIKGLTEAGYLAQERTQRDKRSVRLKLTDKGSNLCAAIKELQNHLAATVDEKHREELDVTRDAMLRLERTWNDYILHGRPR